MTEVLESAQLFNTDTKDISLAWIDPEAVLRVPDDPEQYHAYQLQECIIILKRQAKSSPAQFNSKNLIELLNEFKKACVSINKGDTPDEASTTDDTGGMGNASSREATPVGAGASSGMDSRVSSDNPFSG